MTEQEARTKWCPMVRYSSDEMEPSANRWNFGKLGSDERVNCLASDCMLWRWVMTEDQALYNNTEYKTTCFKPRGYCGLGGKPC